MGERAADVHEAWKGITHVLSDGVSAGRHAAGLQPATDVRRSICALDRERHLDRHLPRNVVRGRATELFTERAERDPMLAEFPIVPTVVAIPHWIAQGVGILDTSISETT